MLSIFNLQKVRFRVMIGWTNKIIDKRGRVGSLEG